MDLLLLAAGRGTRLGYRTRHVPKALLPVQGRPLVDHVLEHAAAISWIERIVIVTGCKAELIREHLSRWKHPKPILEVFNPDYEKGNFYSLVTGLDAVGDGWLLMNVDHIYPRPLLEHARSRVRGVTAVCDADRTLTADCMKVSSLLQADGTRAVAQIDKALDRPDYGYVGLTFVPSSGRGPYMNAVARVLERDDPDAVAESVLQDMANTAIHRARAPRARIADVSGFGWLEVDDESDFRRAESMPRPWPHPMKGAET